MKGCIASIETMGLLDGPGIRCVVFLSGCKLRCKYCHNPEMFKMGDANMSVDDLVKKILRNKPYFRNNSGGVTFSGGEPLLQVNFLIEVCKKLKEKDIHIALDTAGIGVGKYEELLSLIDLVIFDVKRIESHGYKDLVGRNIEETFEFLKECEKQNKEIWIRQVIIPDVNDNIEYIEDLNKFLDKIPNITKVEFLPFHKMGEEKYTKLGIEFPYKNKKSMDKDKCQQLYDIFIQKGK